MTDLHSPSAATPLLQVDALSRSFGGIRAVDGISFSAGTQGITGLIGPNGAGKTTLFNLITGTTRPSAGSVRFQGESISGLSASAIARKGLGRTFQMTRVFPGYSTIENLYRAALLRQLPTPWSLLNPKSVRAGRRIAQAHAERALEQIGLQHVANTDAAALPYGQQKILGVGMALVTQPAMLLMDEPAAGLNAVETDTMSALIESVHASGVAVVLVEHDMNMVMRLCNRIVVLVNGRLLAEGDAASVRTDPRVIEAYLGADLENA